MKITAVSLARIDGRPEHEYLLDKYAIDMVVMNTEVDDAGMNLLLKFLLPKPEWIPVYQDWQSYILVRQGAQSQVLVDRLRLDKQLFLDRMLLRYTETIRQNPRDPRRYFGRGELLGYLGRYDEAERDFAMVSQLDPGNPHLSAKLRQLAKMRELK